MRTEREYLRSTAARCRGRTLIISRDGEGLEAAVRDQVTELSRVPGTTSLPDGLFKTVVITDYLEHLDDHDSEELLRTVWNRLEKGGRLIVSVPNEKSRPESGQTRWFNRRTLGKTLKSLGNVQLATDQPFCWLTMVVRKPTERKPAFNRTNRNRHRTASRLCRGRVIELGCGEGHLTRAIADRGLEVLGVDIGGKRIRQAREFYPDLNFEQMDILEMETEDTYDTVVIAEVLEHVYEETGDAMLEKAWRLLEPGGRLIVSVPNEDCVPHRNHVREFDRRSLKKLLGRWGRVRLITDQPYKWLMMTVEKSP